MGRCGRDWLTGQLDWSNQCAPNPSERLWNNTSVPSSGSMDTKHAREHASRQNTQTQNTNKPLMCMCTKKSIFVLKKERIKTWRNWHTNTKDTQEKPNICQEILRSGKSRRDLNQWDRVHPWGSRDGSEVKSSSFSCKRPDFSSQYPQQVAHKHL